MNHGSRCTSGRSSIRAVPMYIGTRRYSIPTYVGIQKETQMPSNPNQTPAEPRKPVNAALSTPLPLDEVQSRCTSGSDAADRLDLAAAEDPVLDPIGQNPASAEANGKQADLPAGTAAPVPFDVGD